MEDVLAFGEFLNTKDGIKVFGKNGKKHTSIPREQTENKYLLVKIESNAARLKQSLR